MRLLLRLMRLRALGPQARHLQAHHLSARRLPILLYPTRPVSQALTLLRRQPQIPRARLRQVLSQVGR